MAVRRVVRRVHVVPIGPRAGGATRGNGAGGEGATPAAAGVSPRPATATIPNPTVSAAVAIPVAARRVFRFLMSAWDRSVGRESVIDM